jgi:hypothetical protein
MEGSKGILYLCTGRHQDLLNNSISSLVSTNPALPFHVLSDRALTVPFSWVPPLTGKASRYLKTQLFNLSPYDLTLFLDADTFVAEKLSLEEMLGEADLAMALDATPTVAKGGAAFLNYPDFTTREEVSETIDKCGPDFPFYNSGVMLWRKSDKTREFFECWNSEWGRYCLADQLALARTLCVSSLSVRPLSDQFNYPVLAPSPPKGKSIYHLIYKERVAREAGMWQPSLGCITEPDVGDTLEKGIRSESQYLSIAQEIYNSGGSILVISPGDDKPFWKFCSKGNCSFVVEDRFASIEEDDWTFAYNFDSQVGIWSKDVSIPDQIAKRYYFVIINGPAGFSSDCPGRELPIAWAAELADVAIFVFDYNRAWEKELCDRYLGKPTIVVPPGDRGNAELAIFIKR